MKVLVLVGSTTYVCAAALALLAAVPSEATDLVLRAQSAVLHVPEGFPEGAKAEVLRFHPAVTFETYQGENVALAHGEVVVIAAQYPPKELYKRAKNPLAMSFFSPTNEQPVVVVFVDALMEYVGLGAGLPESRYRVALGRVIAHEIEHLKRGTHEHDKSGFFKACLGREQLLTPEWGR